MVLIFLVDVPVFDLKLCLKHFNMFMFHSSFSKERARNTLQTLVNGGDTDRMGSIKECSGFSPRDESQHKSVQSLLTISSCCSCFYDLHCVSMLNTDSAG
ncbi:Hypothetical predicted protein [Scomber scombrus]|uniref:Uncharacterized protein n=1 Tax=Scomber scombrus TaxID=13677 RepID=A0AAV1PX33_SCOSC